MTSKENSPDYFASPSADLWSTASDLPPYVLPGDSLNSSTSPDSPATMPAQPYSSDPYGQAAQMPGAEQTYQLYVPPAAAPYGSPDPYRTSEPYAPTGWYEGQTLTPYSAAPYPYPYPYQATNTQSNGLGLAALICGILSYVLAGPFTGIPAIFLGIAGRKAADEGRANNRGMATAGLILGVVGAILTVFGVLAFMDLITATGF